jgi:hypothetical protein
MATPLRLMGAPSPSSLALVGGALEMVLEGVGSRWEGVSGGGHRRSEAGAKVCEGAHPF